MSMFTRRHYVWLASVCRDMRHDAATATKSKIATEAVDSAIGSLADALADESIGFDRERFMDAIFGDPTNHDTKAA